MTRDDIIKLAREAGFNHEDHYAIEGILMRFAALVAAYERETCAQVCENVYWGMRFQPTKQECADAIRARSQND